MTKKRWFQCHKCGGRTWSERVAQSCCRKCGKEGERIAKGEVIELRQFRCQKCSGRTWYERAEQSKCYVCEKEGELIPRREMVGVCTFNCDCENEFTVICRMMDTAKCYNPVCEKRVTPCAWRPRRRINRKPGSTNDHSCSRCDSDSEEPDRKGNCPNLKPESG